jgi:hypothetical protein
MFGSDWELCTPRGRFRLVRSRGESDFKPTENDLWALLFFAKCEIETEPAARRAILALKAKLEGEHFYPHRADSLDPNECRELESWLEFAIETDAIRFEPQVPVRTRVVAAHQQNPYAPPKPAQDAEETPSFIGVRLKDQDDQPVRRSLVRIELPDGSKYTDKTNRDGELRVPVSVDGEARISLLDHPEAGRPQHVPPEPPGTEAIPEEPVAPPGEAVNETAQWVSFELVDQSGMSVPDRNYVLELSNGELRNGATMVGSSRFEGIPCGKCSLQFPDIEEEAFGAPTKASKPRSASDDTCGGPGYQVGQGEHVGHIASLFRFERLDTIWNNSANSQLAALRQDPFAVAEGDVVAIPEKTVKSHALHPGNHYRITVWRQLIKLQLRLLDFAGTPLSSASCQFTIDGTALEQVSDADGVVEVEVPWNATAATLDVAGLHYDLLLAALPTPSAVAGVDRRLQNLGLYSPTEGQSYGLGCDPEKVLALELLQSRNKLPVDGTLTKDTLQALQDEHGC